MTLKFYNLISRSKFHSTASALRMALYVYFFLAGSLSILSIAETWHLTNMLPLIKASFAGMLLLCGYGVYSLQKWVVPALGINFIWVFLVGITTLFVASAEPSFPIIRIFGSLGAFLIMYVSLPKLAGPLFSSPQTLVFYSLWLVTTWYTISITFL